MSTMDAIQQIQLDDLNDEQRHLAEIIGIEKYKAVIREYGGLAVYIPKAEQVSRRLRNEKIRSEYNGSNYRALATKYGLSEVSIRCIVDDLSREIKTKPIDGQMNLFSP